MITLTDHKVIKEKEIALSVIYTCQRELRGRVLNSFNIDLFISKIIDRSFHISPQKAAQYHR